MDQPQKIQSLLSENEFLQLQLEDLNNLVKNKEAEIELLGDNMDTAASLQSRIDMNLAEIEQLKYNMGLVEQRNAGTEMRNEELELSLMKEGKERQKQQAEVKNLHSVKTELDIVSNELDEATPMYAKIEDLENAVAQAKSTNELLEIENTELRSEIAELKELLAFLKDKKFG